MEETEKKKPNRKVHRTSVYENRTNEGLTIEQEALCRALAFGMPLEDALTTIGSKTPLETVKRWLKTNGKLKDRVAELTAIASKNAMLKAGLDRSWVIERLMLVVNQCMQAEPVKDRKGNPTGEYKFDASGANAALRMLGDTMGMFKPAETKPGDEYAHLSDDDIARIAGELAAQVGLLEAAPRIEAPKGQEQIIDVQAISETDRVS
jgi:phage terminase small subunit